MVYKLQNDETTYTFSGRAHSTLMGLILYNVNSKAHPVNLITIAIYKLHFINLFHINITFWYAHIF